MKEECIEVKNRSDIEGLTNHGTTYRRNKGIFVSTTVGVNEKEVTFVYYYDDSSG